MSLLLSPHLPFFFSPPPTSIHLKYRLLNLIHVDECKNYLNIIFIVQPSPVHTKLLMMSLFFALENEKRANERRLRK